MLASDKTGLQDELANEIVALGKEVESLTLDDIQDGLPRLKCFLYEVHRWYYAAFPAIFFEANEDIEILDTNVPKGQQILVFSRYISKNPYSPAKRLPFGPNGEGQLEFCPRRYLLKEGEKVSVQHPGINSTSFLIFGHGSRICPGKGFSHAIVALVAAALLQNFRMELAPGHEPIGRISGLAETPDKDIRVIFSPRN
jgi:cytochrome P450